MHPPPPPSQQHLLRPRVGVKVPEMANYFR
jgi:hypothetical protein